MSSLLGPNGAPINHTQPQPVTPPEQVQEEQVAPKRVTTAFIVFQLPNGQWMATDDLGMAIVPTRPPVPDDLIGGSENIKQQVIAQKSASMTAQLTVQTVRAVAQQEQAAIPTPQEQAVAASLMNGRR